MDFDCCLEWSVYSALLLILYFSNCRLVISAGLHATSCMYHICSLSRPDATVGSQQGHIVGPHTSSPGVRPLPLSTHSLSPYFHFHFGADFVPILHRFVSKIQAVEFVEMCDHLADSISLFNQLEDFHSHI